MYDLYIMRRTQIYIDDDNDRELTRRAAESGVTKSKLIRRAIREYLESSDGEHAVLERFRTAVRHASGAAPALSDGATYVEQLRLNDQRRQAELDRRRSR